MDKQKTKSQTPKKRSLKFPTFLSALLIAQLIVSFFYLPVNQAKAAGIIYYVDSSITDAHVGSATADCTNYNPSTFLCSGGSASAFKTVADVNASSFSPDDQVLFRKGQSWREQLTVPSAGTSGHPITFGAFGTGALPIINGADVFSSWTQGTLPGSVTQANAKLSLIAGKAFVDFSSAGTLTPYIGSLITITDHSSHSITGYIKAAGTGETYGSELLPDPTMTSAGDFFPQSSTVSILSSGCQSGNCLQISLTGNFGSALQAFSATSGMLLKNSAYLQKGTETNWMWFGVDNASFAQITPSNFSTLPSTWTQFASYATADSTGTFQQYYQGATNGQTSLFDTTSEKQVVTPSATGVTIVSTLGGSTQNWASINGSFNYNDSSGYTYSISGGPSYFATYTTAPAEVFEDGTPLTQNTTSIASLVAGQWFLDTGSSKIWVYTRESDSPTGHTMEASVRPFGVEVNGYNYVTIDSLNVTKASQLGIAIFGGDYSVVQNSTVSYSFTSGIEAWSTSPVRYGIIQGNTVTTSGANGISLSNNAISWTVQGNSVSLNSRLAANNIYTSGIDMAWDAATNHIIQYNDVFSNGPGQSTNAGFGIHVDTGSDGNIIRWNRTHDNNDCNILEEISAGNAIYGNIAYASVQGCGIGIRGASGTPASGNFVYNNTIYGNVAVGTWTGGLLVYGDGGTSAFLNNMFKNNISVGNTTALNAFDGAENDGTKGSGNIYAYNALGTQMSNFITWGASHFSTYSAFDTAYGSSTHSLTSDPQLTNASSHIFTLQSTSPAIDAGLNLGSTYQLGLAPASSWPSSVSTLNQNTNGSGWEMGAYVYTQSTVPSVSITSPSDGATVTGPVAVTGSTSATPPATITSVNFYLDASLLGASSSTSSPSYSWDTTAASNGVHTLTAVATDSYGSTATSSSVSITINNAVIPSGGNGGGGGSCCYVTPAPTLAATSTSTPNSSLVFPASSPLHLVNDKGTFYLVQNGTRQGVTNPGILFSYGFEFKDATLATPDELALPRGSLLLPGNGSLVKSKEDPTVYLISQGQRYGFVSAKVFSDLGFKFTSVLVVTNPELQALVKADNLSNSSLAHLDGIDVSYQGTVYWISSGVRYPYPSLAVYNSWHMDGDFSRVVTANAADIALPVGGMVGMRVVE